MSSEAGPATRTITAEQLHKLSAGGKAVELIDVRTPAEYQSVHVPIARLAPLDSLDPHALMANRALKGEPLYVICRSGARSAKACAAIAEAGYGDVAVNVEGGTLAWEQAGLEVARGRYVLPLDRQVRIAIGSLVLLGAILGYLVSPWFYLVPAFCGAGLIFAGITDICPLAMTIAKMPWNQGQVEQSGGCRA